MGEHGLGLSLCYCSRRFPVRCFASDVRLLVSQTAGFGLGELLSYNYLLSLRHDSGAKVRPGIMQKAAWGWWPISYRVDLLIGGSPGFSTQAPWGDTLITPSLRLIHAQSGSLIDTLALCESGL